MKNLLKKTLSLLIALTMLLGVCSAFAEKTEAETVQEAVGAASGEASAENQALESRTEEADTDAGESAADPEAEAAPAEEQNPVEEPEDETRQEPAADEESAQAEEAAGEPEQPEETTGDAEAAETLETPAAEEEQQEPAGDEEKADANPEAETEPADVPSDAVSAEAGKEAEQAEPQAEAAEGEAEQKANPEGVVDSLEIVIAGTILPNESWHGTVRSSKPTVLKLDVAQAGTLHLVAEGKDIATSVQKSDRLTDDPAQVLTDAETGHSITTWSAEAGSYLISIQAAENSLMAKAALTVMDDTAFAAWEAAQKPEEEMDEEPIIEEEAIEEETIEEAETDETAKNKPESENETERSVDYELTWDSDNPVVGDTAHFKATLIGYDGLTYSLQWQMSPDKEHWTDIEGETGEMLDIEITPERNDTYWRLMVYLEQQE